MFFLAYTLQFSSLGYSVGHADDPFTAVSLCLNFGPEVCNDMHTKFLEKKNQSAKGNFSDKPLKRSAVAVHLSSREMS